MPHDPLERPRAANVPVFPDLAAADIAATLPERPAGPRVQRPHLQGLALPVHDLSRGGSSADVPDEMTVAVAAPAERSLA